MFLFYVKVVYDFSVCIRKKCVICVNGIGFNLWCCMFLYYIYYDFSMCYDFDLVL